VSGPVVVAAGGTGGHLFPAEALAAELLRRGRAVHLALDVRVDAFAQRLPGVAVHRVHAGRFAGSPLAVARGLAGLAFGMREARALLRRLSPAAVVGFGGYPSVPTMLAAARLGLPTVIHEQNAVLGRANRLLAPWVCRIATGFPQTALVRPADRGRAVHTGNPVRPAILAAGAIPYRPPKADEPVELLVLGGSQGARIMSEVVPPALALLPEGLKRRFHVSHQARPEDLDTAAAHYRAAGVAAQLASFFADIPTRLARAHLAICRAGASTIAELAACGRPAVLVPYPHATDDHQTANARAFAEAGGGWVVAQKALDPERLARLLSQLFVEETGAGGTDLLVAAQAARRFGRPDAARQLAALTLALLPDGNGNQEKEERAA
jgi:UDP-N-acetylglucosamine--N-acetylmuramyl-(pentapeptide) pyrophosphoryl-undecaprenol N-acetylglucosamine transferase